MSTLTKAEVQKMAELSKLELPEDKLAVLTTRLEKVLALVEKMNQAKTQDIEPLAHPFNATQPLRDDIISEKNQRELFQQNAPQIEAGLYIVPKFIESE